MNFFDQEFFRQNFLLEFFSVGKKFERSMHDFLFFFLSYFCSLLVFILCAITLSTGLGKEIGVC